MQITIHHIVEFRDTPAGESRLTRIERLLTAIVERIGTMSQALDRVTTEVSETKGVIESAVVLIQSMADQIRNNAEDPVALNRLADDLDASTNALAAAVAANSPAPAPTPEP